MAKNKVICVIEFKQNTLGVTLVNETVMHQSITLFPGEDRKVINALNTFVRKSPIHRVIALSARASCLMGTFRLPSRDQEELLSMAKFQFARSTPHRKDDMVVDVKMIESVSQSQTLIAGAMVAKEILMPFLGILKGAGLNPDVVTVNTQRLLPLAKVIWSNGLNGEGKILGFCLEGTFSLGFFARGDLLFTREESQISDSALGAFIEYCHKEFPSIAIKEGLILGGVDDAGMARTIAGVPVNVQELSSFVRTTQEQSAFEIAPVAFLDLLLARDGETRGFDFSPDSVKAERSRLQIVTMAVHVAIILALLLSALALRGFGDLYQKAAHISALKNAVNRELPRVGELEKKSRTITSVENYISSKVMVSSVMISLSKMLPTGAHLTELEFQSGILNVRGEADDLEAVRTFQGALQGSPLFKDVKLQGIDKRPTESSQMVMFQMTLKVSK